MKQSLFLSVGLIATLTAMLIAPRSTRADWVAGRDLANNERPNGPQELSNPNATVPEWSYGYRFTVGGTALTPFPNHFNDGGGYPFFDGWDTFGIPTAAVNAGPSSLTINNGPGPLVPLQPNEMLLHPSGALSVVRWTAPANGVYILDAYWNDIDPYGGGGGDGHIVVNGTSIYDAFWPNGGGATAPTQSISLNLGDVVDFALGPNGDFFFDSTAFDATITGTPEPSSFFGFLSVGLCSVFFARRLLDNKRPCAMPD
jgi:hypothetical protein